MDTWNGRPLNGCLFETELVSAPSVSAKESDFPERVDLREYCSPVEDQGQTNSCTANAIVGALEYHQRRLGRSHVDLSRMFAYYNARRLADMEAYDAGSLIHHVMASVMAYGVCEESVWPFQPGNCLMRPPQHAYQNAEKFQAVQYGRTPLGVSAMSALAAGIPVVFGAYLPGEFYNVATATGEMPQPGPTLTPSGGGHAMLLVGYDRSAACWIVRNSWGTGFGDNGYFRIPFRTLEAYAVPQHFWTIGAIDAAVTLKLRQPESSQSTTTPITVPSHLKIDLEQMRQDVRRKLENDLARQKEGFRSRLRS